MSDIILKDIYKNFGEKKAINGFSGSFPLGKITCIIGASGSGKTTLLRIIAGLISADSGTVAGVPEKKAFVFQDDRLCEEFSAVSNIKLVCGKTLSKKQIIEHLSELSLENDLKKPVSEFSGGMKRRVAIARAICFDADLIILDEPFKGLDMSLKNSIMDYVMRHTSGKTVICVTHDLSEAEYMGAEIMTLENAK